MNFRLPLLTIALAASFVSAGAASATVKPRVVKTNLLTSVAGQARDAAPAAQTSGQIAIPGPLRSFMRMAGLSQKALPEEVLPLLSEVVAVRGYALGRPTEFLALLTRYLHQASELVALAGAQGVIHVSNCQDAQPLLDILGYRLQNPCGPDTAVQTADPDRAFLTIDSGFPLAELEESLRSNKPFVLPFQPSPVPVLFTPGDWNALVGNPQNSDLINTLLLNPPISHLYSALSRMDSETRTALARSPGLPKLLRFASVLDFYGDHLSIRSGQVLVPGGTAAEPAWKELVGANPQSPDEFVLHLLSKDAGWLAAYFDALTTTSPAQQAYFTEPNRLKRFYEALRGSDPLPGAAKGVFRPDPGLVLLTSRLEFDANGQPHVPGDLALWKEIFRLNPDSKRTRLWARRAQRWTEPDQVVEGLIAISREAISESAFQTYLVLCDLDRSRPPQDRLTPQTAHLLAEKFSRFGDQYSIFSEFSTLNNDSITDYMTTALALDRIVLPSVRGNAIGIFQANLGLWQILVRQGEIPKANLNASWRQVIGPFSHMASAVDLFDAGSASMRELWRAATGRTDLTEDEVISLLAGPVQNTKEGQQVRENLASKIQAVISAQRLVSLDTLLTLGNGLNEMAQGKANGDSLLPLAAELREFEMPRPIFTASEKFEFQYGRSDTSHTTLQTRVNVATIIKSGNKEELAAARGRLAPFLRDTLVGLNYAYYQPPGAQMLLNNAIFVRSHDYSERTATEGTQPWKTPELINMGVTVGGGTHLAGSLADLPYALALVEQDFIVPEHVQSLIWQDLVPSLLTNAVVPRWWNVSQNELHAVALYQRCGEALLNSSAGNEELRQRTMEILSKRISPQRAERIERALSSGQADEAIRDVVPAETFFLAATFYAKYPNDVDRMGAEGKELDGLVHLHSDEVSLERLSRDFGVSHPALAHSYALELMNNSFFPTFRDYSSRLLGESWESNNLYWARLADELGYPAVALNRLVPELTRRMIEKLFASTLEDWPAISRAMQETGEEFRGGKISTISRVRADSRP